MRRHPPKFAFGDAGERSRGRELDDRRHVRLPQCLGAQVPAHRPGQLGHQLAHRVGGRGDRLAVGVRQQGGGRFGGRDIRRGGGVAVGGRRHEVGVERAGGGQLADPRLGRRVLGELVQRGQAAGGDDLAGGVAVGGDQVEVLEARSAPRPRRRRAPRTCRWARVRRPWPSRRRGWRPARRRRRRRSRRRSRRRRSRRPSVRRRSKSRPASRPRLVSSWWASSVAATTSGCVTAVSVISSAVAVVPSRRQVEAADLRPRGRSGQPRRAARATEASMPGVCEPCPGASKASTCLREHCENGFARCKRL